MKYKVGDEVLLRAKITEVRENTFPNLPYMAKITSMREWKGVGVESVAVTEINEDVIIDMTAEEAWEIARKIVDLYFEDPGEEFSSTYTSSYDLLMKLTPQQAKVQIEAWKEKKEFRVGDIVKGSVDQSGIVTFIDGDKVTVMWVDGSCREGNRNNIKKTGRHIDIQGLLEQIGGAE